MRETTERMQTRRCVGCIQCDAVTLEPDTPKKIVVNHRAFTYRLTPTHIPSFSAGITHTVPLTAGPSVSESAGHLPVAPSPSH